MWSTLLVLSSLFLQSPRLDCPEIEPRTIRVDGIINEWSVLTPLKMGKSDIVSGEDRHNNDKDLSASIRCTYAAGEGFFLLVEVTDSRIIVGNRKPEFNDHVVISAGDPKKKITFIPPDEGKKAVITGLPKNAQGRVVRQEYGYAIELGLPWGTFDLQPDMIQVPLSITIYDVDSAVAGKPETVMALDKAEYPKTTNLEFAAIRGLQQEAFEKLGVSDKDIRLTSIGNYAPGKKQEKLIWVDRYLVVLGGDVGVSFFFMQMAENVQSIVKFEPVDVDGDGLMEFFTELKASDGDNNWKMIAIWGVEPRGFARLFSHMLEFSSGDHFLVNEYKMSRKAKKTTLEFSFVKASGSITKKDWKGDPPDPDILPFILPWTKPQKMSYSFAHRKYVRNK